MKISREIIINGESQNVEYELTGIELERAFNECQNRKEKDDIVNRLREDEFEGIEDIPDDLIQRMAEKYHKFLDEYSVNVKSAAMNDVLEKFGAELEPYKEKWKVFSCEVTQTKTHTYTVRAKNSTDAENILNNWFDHHESQVVYDFEDELADTDFGWMEEKEGFDPDNADIIVEG